MTNEKFIEILSYIHLPCGTLLNDGATYRLCKQDFPSRKFSEELDAFEKMLVLSDGNNNVVGGVLFYDNVDIQVVTLPSYRKHGYMSAIHKNGILKSECYPNQKVTIAVTELRSLDDFLVRVHMLRMACLKVSNLPEVYNYLKMLRQIECTKDEFVRQYS